MTKELLGAMVRVQSIYDFIKTEERQTKYHVLNLHTYLINLKYSPIEEMSQQVKKPVEFLLSDEDILIYAKLVEKYLNFKDKKNDEDLWSTRISVCGYIIIDKETHEVLDTFSCLIKPFFNRNEVENEEYGQLTFDFINEFDDIRKALNSDSDLDDYEYSA